MIDPLLQSLVYVSRYYGQANSPEALIADLPLADGLLTAFLLPRAAEKAGLQAKDNKSALNDISPLLFPVIALLKGGDSCVILSIDNETDEAEVVLSQSGDSQQWININDLNQQYTGHLFLIKKRFRYDERSPEILKTRDGHWFWSTLWLSRSIYRDVFIASILINIFAISAPLFTRLVYDKIVPNLAFDSLWVLSIGITIIFGFDLGLARMHGQHLLALWLTASII